MKFIEEILGIPPLSDVASHRLILSLFCLLTFSILIYFWNRSRNQLNTNKSELTGLLTLSMVFLLYCALGTLSVYKPGKMFYLIVSAGVNICYLLSLSFFAQGSLYIDKLVKHNRWKAGVLIAGAFWIMFLVISRRIIFCTDVDLILSSIAQFLVALFITRTFVRRGLNLLAFVTGFLFLFFIFLQCNSPELLGKGRFTHINTTILSPALFISIITVSYTFSWMNEQLFLQMARIYTGPEGDENAEPFEGNIGDLAEKWKKLIAKDDLEKVIEGLLAFKKFKNDSMELVINIARRNNSNNANHLKGLIKFEDFQTYRTRIAQALFSLI